jgi:16S rRNA (cytosine1402-N4)-methyltransferase
MAASDADFVHTPALPEETVTWLAPRRGGELMVDATIGEGGHSFLFLSRFPDLKVVGVDADAAIQERARERLKAFGERVRFYTGWSQDFFASYPADIERPDTVLMDLGVSLYHYEKSGRGFSFRQDEPLDMRLDTSCGVTAAGLVAGLSEKDLAGLLYANAEERYSRRIARSIVEARRGGKIAGSAALARIVERAVPAASRRGPAHPATKTFQALRIEVNGELSRLQSLLDAALEVLKPGGRLGVITFHSLEDRLVKNFFREKSRDYSCLPDAPIGESRGRRLVKVLTKKGVAPGEEEKRRNPPSRSARLRVVEKIVEGEE